MKSSTQKTLDALKRAQHIAGLRSQVQQGVEVALRDLRIPSSGVAYVRSAMAAPSRREGGGASNWHGFAPSAKLGVAVGFESATLEYPATTKCERDEATIAYFNQAPYLKVTYTRANEKRGGHSTRPDFLVVRQDVIALVECKMEAELLRESQHRPWLYEREGDHWISPPGQRAAAEMGFSHWIWTERTFTPVGIKNHLMLEDYLSSGKDELAEADAEARRSLLDYLETHPQATINAVSHALRDVATIDQIYRAIAFRAVAVNFDYDSLADQDRCTLYRDESTMQAYLASATCPRIGKGWMKASQLTFKTGVEVEWDGACWKLVNVGATEVTLASANSIETLPRKVFNSLVDRSKITERTDAIAMATNELAAKAQERIRKASPNDLRYAALCLRKIEPFLHRKVESRPPPTRTQRRHLAAYRAAEAVYGSGFVGLLPGFSKCGNTRARLAEETLKVVQERVNTDYANPKGVRAKRVHDSIAKECKAKGYPAPSYAWFCRFIKRLDIYNLKKAREGSRAANNDQPRVLVDEHGIDLTAERQFERAGLDHTELDLETRDSRTSKKTGKVWASILVCLCTRRILAFHLTFEPPSYRSVLAVMRDCVRRWGRLPAAILVDGGKDMASTWFETTCAFFHVKVFRRPAARPRFGSQNERTFGTINSMFAHALCGNTQLRKNVRQMTDEVDPDAFSIWTLVELYRALEEFLFDVYDNLPHRELHESPREAFERLLARYGDRPERRIAYNSDFLITTCPSTPKGTARVQPDGVKLNYIYFNHPQLARYLRKDVPVRYDPDDMCKAYAFVDKEWLPLSSKYTRQLRGRSEHEIKLLTAEHRARRSETEREAMSSTLLVDFLDRIAMTEEQLLRQRQINEQRLLADSLSAAAIAHDMWKAPSEDDDHVEGQGDDSITAKPDEDDASDLTAVVPATPSKAPRNPKTARAVTLIHCEEF